jgi:hypothetical protein
LEESLLGLPSLARGGGFPADLQNRFLAVPEEKGVEEVGQRLGVQGAGPAADDQRKIRSPLRGPERDARQIEDVQDAGIVEFVLEGEPEDVEIPEGESGFEGPEREAAVPEVLLHVRPGGKDPFAGDVRAFVEDMVEDLESDMGHAHFVNVREGEGEFEANPGEILDDGVEFPAGVPGGLGDFQKVVLIHKKILASPGGDGNHG